MSNFVSVCVSPCHYPTTNTTPALSSSFTPPAPNPPPPLHPHRIMAFVVLSLILSWASLGAGTATAVVRKHCLKKIKKYIYISLPLNCVPPLPPALPVYLFIKCVCV